MESVGLIVWLRTLVSIYNHETVPLTVRHRGSERTIYRDFQEIRSKSVSLSVWVCEQSCLENSIGRRLDTWH